MSKNKQRPYKIVGGESAASLHHVDGRTIATLALEDAGQGYFQFWQIITLDESIAPEDRQGLRVRRFRSETQAGDAIIEKLGIKAEVTPPELTPKPPELTPNPPELTPDEPIEIQPIIEDDPGAIAQGEEFDPAKAIATSTMIFRWGEPESGSKVMEMLVYGVKIGHVRQNGALGWIAYDGNGRRLGSNTSILPALARLTTAPVNCDALDDCLYANDPKTLAMIRAHKAEMRREQNAI